jgi:hypothetical protein
LSTPSIMRLPETVLTTLYEALLEDFLLHGSHHSRRKADTV